MRVARFTAFLPTALAGSNMAFSSEGTRSRANDATSSAEGSDEGGSNDAQVSDDQQQDDGRDRDGERGARSAAEWTTLIVSALLVALLIGAALYEHFARDEPPGVHVAVELALDQAEVRDGLTYIPFTVVNTGAESAQNVVVLFEIKQGDETVEESTTEIALLPNSGSAEGELVTALDLSSHTVEARVATIQHP